MGSPTCSEPQVYPGAIFQIHHWNHFYNTNPRTNNHSEGDNNALNVAVGYANPTVYHLISVLKNREMEKMLQYINRFKNNEHLKIYRRPQDIKTDEFLVAQKNKLVNQQISLRIFIKSVSNLYSYHLDKDVEILEPINPPVLVKAPPVLDEAPSALVEAHTVLIEAASALVEAPPVLVKDSPVRVEAPSAQVQAPSALFQAPQEKPPVLGHSICLKHIDGKPIAFINNYFSKYKAEFLALIKRYRESLNIVYYSGQRVDDFFTDAIQFGDKTRNCVALVAYPCYFYFGFWA